MANAPAPPDTGALTSDHARLQELTTAANLQYKLKNYNAAADLFSDALELQDKIFGEMAPENAELLYQYGRCLYHVAVSSSDVLGGKIAGEEKPQKTKKRTGGEISKARAQQEGDEGSVIPSAEERLAEEVVEAAVEEKDGMKPAAVDGPSVENKPYFQITGDDNWLTDDEDEEGEEGQDGEGNVEEDDDFAIAYEILDSARVLLSRKLDAVRDGTGNGEASGSAGKGKEQARDDTETRQIKERLAEIHDLQGEISLENERFHHAVNELRGCLAVRKELYPEESALLAEAHYKLALALEMASAYTIRDAQREAADGKAAEGEPEVDKNLLTEAAEEMEAAISSCRLRIRKEEADLPKLDPAAQQTQKKSIKDVEEMVEEMQQRLIDLRNPTTRTTATLGPAGTHDGSAAINGVLGAMLGESPAQQKARIEQATKSANDLSGLVKHKKKSAETEQVTIRETNGSSKRKLGEDVDEGRERAKSVRIDEA